MAELFSSNAENYEFVLPIIQGIGYRHMNQVVNLFHPIEMSGVEDEPIC
jgi:hypothetical protein